jgi:hypothetical protein
MRVSKTDFRRVRLDAKQLENAAEFEIDFYVLACKIEDKIPDSAHRTAALRLLLEAKMSVMHTISRSVLAAGIDESAPANAAFENRKDS